MEIEEGQKTHATDDEFQAMKQRAVDETMQFLEQIDKHIEHHADALALFSEQKLTWLHRACMIRGIDSVRADLGRGMRLYWATVEGEPVTDESGEPVQEITSTKDIAMISVPVPKETTADEN
tara:strand:- start:572 stop:937 length:366 start_codon:yes stop_codon:yes gene_type:complete